MELSLKAPALIPITTALASNVHIPPLLELPKANCNAAVLIRGIWEAWVRQPNNSALTTLIHSYCDVQVSSTSYPLRVTDTNGWTV